MYKIILLIYLFTSLTSSSSDSEKWYYVEKNSDEKYIKTSLVDKEKNLKEFHKYFSEKEKVAEKRTDERIIIYYEKKGVKGELHLSKYKDPLGVAVDFGNIYYKADHHAGTIKELRDQFLAKYSEFKRFDEVRLD